MTTMPTFKLTPYQQRLVELVVSQAEKDGALYLRQSTCESFTCTAMRSGRGHIAWKLFDFRRREIASGKCP